MSIHTAEWSAEVTASKAHRRLVELETERELALEMGLGENDAYMTDLDAELEHHRGLYVAAVVTEIATYRGELFGRGVG
jgi:hypothetical protein